MIHSSDGSGCAPRATSYPWLAISLGALALVSAAWLIAHAAPVIAVEMALAAAFAAAAALFAMLRVHFKQAKERRRLDAEHSANAQRSAADASRRIEELQQSEQRFQSAFTHAAVGMLLATTKGRILQANATIARLLGRDEDDLAGTSLSNLFPKEELDMLRIEIDALVGDRQSTFVAELRCVHSSGAEVIAAVSGSVFAVPAPLGRCVLLLFQDITARTQAEARLQYIASHDSLTDLANRKYFMESLSEAIAVAGKQPDRRFAVLFLDFDRFKLVNDSLGHGAGDALLKGVARRLQDHLRPDDLVARFGGDEFAILVQDPKADREAVQLAERISEIIAQPLQVNGVAISTSASIGITTSAFGYESPEDVVRDADTAMYRAKAQGRARFAVFDSALHSHVADRLWLESELRRAVANEALALVYQPIYDCASRALIGFEALARWTHGERGAIPRETFIRIAEETGLIVPLGTWALVTACRTLACWRAISEANGRLSMHVNVSGVQLAQPDFPAVVRGALRETNVDPRQLIIEITESVLIATRTVAIPHLEELRAFGVAISLDDFGTGYSSFSLLNRLPVDEIKIDRSFVDQLGASDSGDAVVATMLSLGRTLGKTMVAEGIETESQLARLVAMGCSNGQGYLLGRPLSVRKADTLVRSTVQERDSTGQGQVVPIREARQRSASRARGDGQRSSPAGAAETKLGLGSS